MIKINKPPEPPKSRRGLVYVLRERLKELTKADTEHISKTERQKARALALYRIALVLRLDGITTYNANRRLPEIAQRLSEFISIKELSKYSKIAKYLPKEQVDPGN